MSSSSSSIPSQSLNIDITSPNYLGSSDNPSQILVTTVFNGVGFSAWKRSMIISLSAKNKLSFFDGTITAPPVNSPTYSGWHRVNSMVISWILNLLHKNITESVLFLPTAHEIWQELKQRYDQSNNALIYQIQQQLYYVAQNSDDFSTYFTKLTKIWDELRVVQDIPSCTCGSAAKI